MDFEKQNPVSQDRVSISSLQEREYRKHIKLPTPGKVLPLTFKIATSVNNPLEEFVFRHTLGKPPAAAKRFILEGYEAGCWDDQITSCTLSALGLEGA